MGKGSILDLAGVLLIVVGLVIGGFLAFKFYSEFKEKYSQMPLSTTEQTILNKGTAVYNVLLNSIPFIVIGSGIGAIILAFLIPSHPIFLPVSILALAIFIILSVVFSNFVWEFLNSQQIVGMANQYPLLVNVVQYLPYIIAVFGIVLIIVMYSKSGSYE
jgi:ABC-type bacteriocin/lantibiotic exporter with double-glycine peptidase domain